MLLKDLEVLPLSDAVSFGSLASAATANTRWRAGENDSQPPGTFAEDHVMVSWYA